jgi:hypothetical protein
MALHCIDVVYSPSTGMDDFLETWLTNWSAWSEESLTGPESLTFTDVETGNSVDASGFRGNRFQLDSSDHASVIDVDVSNNTVVLDKGMTGNIVGGETFQLRRSDGTEETHTVSDFTSNGNGTTDVILESLDTRSEGQTAERRRQELVGGTAFFTQYIVSNLIGATGFLNAYTDWAVVRAHVCSHNEPQDQRRGCGDWYIIHTHGDIPEEISYV